MKTILTLVCCLALVGITRGEDPHNRKGKKGGQQQAAAQAQTQVAVTPKGKGKGRGLGVRNSAVLNTPKGQRHLERAAAKADLKAAGGIKTMDGVKAKTRVGKIRHFDLKQTTNIKKVTFKTNNRIIGAENWQGKHYNAFRLYHSEWHDQSWWRQRHNRIVFVFGGWYYFDNSYWYPAWGYAPNSYYAYDGPIYAYNSLPPDQVVANVQTTLLEEGYYHGEVDGQLGPLTRAAIAGYQQDHGLYVTSAIDEPTLSALGFS
ncbi:MAG: peptidoglycan-binding domain-containing protein [Spartobacteria bacterium]